MQVVVATHGHCFDGLASAVMFTRLASAAGAGQRSFTYRGCGYGAGQLRPDDRVLVGDENAILDYRFAASPRLTWYFDHHRTAFATPEERALFERSRGTGRFYFDAECSSCTKLIARVGEQHFAFKDPVLHDLVHWADIVDAARFDTPEAAIDRTNPVMRMVSVVEQYGDDRFLAKVVPLLLERPLSEVAASQEIENRYRPLGKKHERFVERVRARAVRAGRVVFVDLTDAVLETVGKFVTYALYPDSTYSVMVGLFKNGVKISVGYNPWSGKALDTDISEICARFGGGGHPVVGGISLKTSELERAKEIAMLIIKELDG